MHSKEGCISFSDWEGTDAQELKNSQSASYLITNTYYNRAMQDADNRIPLAGDRLAKLLNENLK